MQTRLAILCHQSDTVATPNGNRLKSEALKKVSIHAPVWGATAYLVTDSYYN